MTSRKEDVKQSIRRKFCLFSLPSSNLISLFPFFPFLPTFISPFFMVTFFFFPFPLLSPLSPSLSLVFSSFFCLSLISPFSHFSFPSPFKLFSFSFFSLSSLPNSSLPFPFLFLGIGAELWDFEKFRSLFHGRARLELEKIISGSLS
jgi:hypothetical protein